MKDNVIKRQRKVLEKNRNAKKSGLTRSLKLFEKHKNTKFGKITVLELGPVVNRVRKWKVICDCGKVFFVRPSALFNKDSVSCGCYRDKKSRGDHIGERYGMVVVIEDTGKSYINKAGNSKETRGIWKFRCDCGVVFEDVLSFVKKKNPPSCGCATRSKEEGSLSTYYDQYKRGAEIRGYEFALNLEEFKKIIKKPCYYCKASPTERDRFYYPIKVNGIDRIDNTKGYSMKNVVACCTTCNRMKGTLSFSVFMDYVTKIADRSCGDDYNTRTTYVTESNVGDTSKILLLCIYDLSEKFNLQKAEIMALFKAVLDEHIIEYEE